jgi:hypothetical protein|tara:strand:- start:106 stop:423 length:318 start_codon:yes stop_codon:yes gene_type:complete
MKNKFLSLLSNIKYPTEKQRLKELWDVEGILRNQKFKFDLRPLKNNAKAGTAATKADKMVFDIKDQWIIVDLEELHQYLKQNNLKKVYLNELISNLDWNIILPKY